MTSQASNDATFAVAEDRVAKGRLLMAGLADEIRGLWDTLGRIEGAPAPNGSLNLSDNSIVDVLNWLRRALTSVRSLDLEVFQNSNERAYLTLRAADDRGMAVKGLIGPRNNAVHHPEVVDPGVDRAMGPFTSGRYFIFPTWVHRTQRLDAMFTDHRGVFSEGYAAAYGTHIAGRSLLDPVMDAFDFFDTMAPDLARRDADGQLDCFPLPPPPFADAHLYFRLMPSSPNETRQRTALDIQLRFMLEMSLPTGRVRVITGAFRSDEGEVVLTGYTDVRDTFRHAFLDRPDQVQLDIRGGFRYLLSLPPAAGASDPGPVEVAGDLTLPGGQPFPVDGLVTATANEAEVAEGRWELCQKDASYYQQFRRPRG